MTASKHRKHLIHARMARTGESYSTARGHVLARTARVALTPAYTIPAHGRHGQAVTFSADGTLLASGGQDGAARFWHAADGSPAFALEGHDRIVNAVVLLDGGATAVTASSDRTVRVWDVPSRTARATLTGHRDAVTTLAVLPAAAAVVSAGYDGRLRWWDLATATCVHEVRSPLGRIAALASLPGGGDGAGDGDGPRPVPGRVLAAGTGGAVIVHDAGGDEIRRIETGAPGVVGLALSPRNDVLVAAGYDGALTVWDVASWDLLRRIEVGARATAVAISATGDLLAAAWDHHVGVWALGGDVPVASERLPIKGVYAVAFAPDGGRLAQTGADGRVRCWRLR